MLQQMALDAIDDTPVTIALRDVAPGGIGFVCHQPLRINSTWRVGFLDHNCTFAHQPMTVSHCRLVETSGDVYLAGGPFCAETGLLCVLGIDPREIRDGDGPAIHSDESFLAPDDV